ncbi:MAG: flagellar biosynthetic protein FliR [Desulfobulbaceae bacterium]|nr:flagellar biosynthetic protein FliR [Desulfobulbaceae bacterium]
MVDTAILNWSLSQALALLVIIVRVGPMVFLMPVIGSPSVPAQVKALFTLMISLVLLPVVPVSAADLPTTSTGFALFVAMEVLFGGILALFARFVFAAVEIAGQMVGVQMGMGMAGAIDPQYGTQTSQVGLFWSLVSYLLFFSIDGHHMIFRVLTETFTWVRPGGLHLSQATYEGIIRGGGHMFVLAVKVMAPAAAVLFFADVAMGILAKTVPQIPIMIVGMPVKIAIGFIFVGLSLNYFLPLMLNNFEMLGRLLPRLAMGMGG